MMLLIFKIAAGIASLVSTGLGVYYITRPSGTINQTVFSSGNSEESNAAQKTSCKARNK
jgi:hypothetical protein